jgi:lipoyl(octanoyl) transferase
MGTPSTSTSRRSDALAVVDWGLTRYDDALARQHALVESRLRGEAPDTLVLTEHEPVVTLGRGTDPRNVFAPGAAVVAVERGGEATWHGPGQVVGYLIRLLPAGSRDLPAFLRILEDLVCGALAGLGVSAARAEGRTGVWVEHEGRTRKIASIGIAARRWCTYHGFALNVDCDLAAFRGINPCGFDASVMTSVRELLGASPGVSAAKQAIRQAAERLRLP